MLNHTTNKGVKITLDHVAITSFVLYLFTTCTVFIDVAVGCLLVRLIKIV